MPTFYELAQQGEFPAVHSLRKDQATLIATRVPLTDPGLGGWGWILTLNHKNGRTEDNTQFHQELQEQTIDAYNRLLKRFHLNTVALDQQVVTQSVGVTEVVAAQSLLTREETGRHVETLNREIKNHVSLTQKNTLDAVEEQFLMSKADTANHLLREREEIRTGLTGFTTELKALEEQIKLLLSLYLKRYP